MLNITPIPAFSDNYIWMLSRENSKLVVLVDPGDKNRILDYLQRKQLVPVAVLITHQHYDHTGGVAALVDKYPGLRIIAPGILPSRSPLSIDLPIPEYVTERVADGDEVEIAELDIRFKVLGIPGHTLDHLAYYAQGMVFCGDILFGCGCGRLFSGSAEQMTDSLNKISALPAVTKIYCAHEYTLANIGFARWVEPDNEDLLRRDDEDMARQEKGIPTLPSTLDLELKTNPFLRYRVPVVKQAAEKFAGKKLTTDAEVFAAIRRWKDTEYD